MVSPAVVAEMGGEASGIPLAEHPLLAGVEILAIRDTGEVICMMPLDRIDHEEVLVKTEWAASLARQMQKAGQKSTITLAVIEGEPLAKIGDGFHREAGLLINGYPSAFASVEYMDWNALYDHRIITAKDHVHVRFSRVVEWMGKVWEHSGLADKMTIEQAVLLYTFDNPGSKLGLDPVDVEAAKEWVARKEEQWEMSAMTFHGYLVTAQNVDPQLVHSTREKRHGKALEAPTQSIIKVFSQMLPNQFELQNLVMQAAMAHNLKSPEVRALCRSVARCDTVEDATRLIVGIDWEKWEPEYGETKARALRRAHDARHKGAVVLDKASKDVKSVAERLKSAMEKGEEITPTMKANAEAALTKATALYWGVGALVVQLSEFVGKPTPEITSVAVGKAAARAAGRQSAADPQTNQLGEKGLAATPGSVKDELPEPDIATDEDFDPEDELDDERVVIEEEDEVVDDDEGVDIRPEALFDEDFFDLEAEETDDDEEEPFKNYSPAVHQLVPPRQSPGTIEFKERLRAYLNSTSRPRPPLPTIETSLQISLAESILLRGTFSGHPDLQEDVRDNIDRARRKLRAERQKTA